MERYAHVELVIAQRRLDDATHDVQRLRAKLKAAAGSLAQDHSIDRSLYYAHVEHMHSAIQQKGKIVTSCGAEADSKRRKFIAVTKKRKVLERLKTRRADAHFRAEQLLEQRDIDESNLCDQRSPGRGHSRPYMAPSRNIRADKWT